MTDHTFIGKKKLCYTDISDFTDIQGIGHDPLYRRYDSVESIVQRHISPEYQHFFATPDYLADEGQIAWHIATWSQSPIRYPQLSGDEQAQYSAIKEATLSHYRAVAATLSGEERQILNAAIKYVDDERIYCADGRVFLVAWGMTPDTKKYKAIGEVLHEVEGIRLPTEEKPKEKEKEKEGTTTPVPPPPPEEIYYTCRFVAGAQGILKGISSTRQRAGTTLSNSAIPQVQAKKGYKFLGWDRNPQHCVMDGDKVFTAQYERIPPWYKRWGLWPLPFVGRGCLRWILWLLLAILLIVLMTQLLRDCKGCTHGIDDDIEETDTIVCIDSIVRADGTVVDDNGYVRPITDERGTLPKEGSFVAPVMGEGGTPPTIIRQPGLPAVLADRLFLFLEDDNDDVEALAHDFKAAYPQDDYAIVGYDKEVKLLVIQVPADEKDALREALPGKLPQHRFIVFDEEVYDLNGVPTPSPQDIGWHLRAIHLKQGWDITRGSSKIKVAIVDDGIQGDHPLFAGRITEPYNVFRQDNALSTGVGHGTHTAALAAGNDKYYDKGAAGVAPDCKIMPVQVIDNGLCPLSALVAGVMYAIHHDADVVNISIGPQLTGLSELPVAEQEKVAQSQFTNESRLWERVCRLAAKKNCILVFSAGNDKILSSIPPENRNASSLVVAAVDQSLTATTFTNYGDGADISAPGKDIYSAFPTNDFRAFDGTSMAAPIVTGTIALMKSIKKDLTVEEARNVLYRTGADVTGWIPPMVLVDKVLEATRAGDFSRGPERTMRPAPATGDDGKDIDYDAIRRQIEEYEKKIEELKKMLP